MEIPAWLYFSFWNAIGVTFLLLGFDTSNKSGLSDSVSPVVMSLFGHSLAISIFHSSNYALIFRPIPKLPLSFYLWSMLAYTSSVMLSFMFFTQTTYTYYFLAFLWLYITKIFIVKNYFYWNSEYTGQMYPELEGTYPRMLYYVITCVGLLLSCFGVPLEIKSEYLEYGKTKLFPILIFFISYLTSMLWRAVFYVENENPLTIKKNKKRKLIEFAIGMMGTVLFQYFFKITSFDHVKVFLYFTIVWLANLALLRPSFGDYGIFTFLLGNVIVGCTVSQFGLRGTTWFACGVCFFLYALRLELESLPLVNRGRTQVIVLFRKEKPAQTQAHRAIEMV